MKKLINFILVSYIITSFCSCDLFKLDNYDEPGQTISGTIWDKNHPSGAQPVLTNQGSEGIRIRLQEISWSETAEYHDMWCMKEGVYNNTKLFKGTYYVQCDGPFVPLKRTMPDGTVIEDKSWTGEIKGGKTTVDFDVEPFLRIEWVGEPVILSDRRIQCSFKVTRGVTEARLKELLEPTGTWSNNSAQILSINLFCSESPHLGWNQGQDYWRVVNFPSTGNSVDYDWATSSEFEDHLGFDQTITLTTQPVPAGHVVFVRCGARIRYQTVGVNRPNYNEIKRVDMPE